MESMLSQSRMQFDCDKLDFHLLFSCQPEFSRSRDLSLFG